MPVHYGISIVLMLKSYNGANLDMRIFLKKIGGHQFLWVYPSFGLLMLSALGFRVDLLAYFP